MPRPTRHNGLQPCPRRSAAARRVDYPRSITDRRLRLESLEDRRLLAVFMVTNLNNTGGGSLRSAVALANDAGSVDEIRFAANLSGGTISLTTGEIEITDALTIDAAPLAANVTINANQLSRIFNITVAAFNYTFTGLNLTGGRPTSLGGGAIRSLTPLLLTLSECNVSGNSTGTNFGSDGGGIYASGDVTLIESTISGNRTMGNESQGGGIYTDIGEVTLTRSTVSGNSTMGSTAPGGGIRGGGVTLIQSTVSGNSTTNFGSSGGGIHATGDVTLIESTVSGNSTMGINGHGGGIYTDIGEVTLTRSTVSGNSTMGNTTSSNAGGGGIRRWRRIPHPKHGQRQQHCGV